ncbi:MAG TPA: type VI secretion system protein TssA [Blastocatellia bacterium]|nr:type VI secretion system protein TssA [Blastocatellia bacterium]
MSITVPVADLEALLKPISTEAPAGQDLRSVLLDPKKGFYWHDRIREAHRENPYETVPKLADWPAVMTLSTQALTSLSKDLQIAAWLSDALVKSDRHDRLAGLHQSLKLMRGLIEQYWEGVFPAGDPESDDGHFAARANIMAVFDSRIAFAIKAIPLTESAGGLRYSFLNWEESRLFDVPDKDRLDSLSSDEQDRVQALKEQAAREQKITSEDWRKAANGTPYQFFKERLDLLEACHEELTALDETMDLRFQREAPGVKELRKALEDVTSVIKPLEKEKRPPELMAADGEAEPSADGDSGLPPMSGSVRTRQEALRRLAEVAEFFRQTEPHSPVSYLLHRAIKWGNMPLENWLEEVVKDSSVLSHLRETLGIKPDGQ